MMIACGCNYNLGLTCEMHGLEFDLPAMRARVLAGKPWGGEVEALPRAEKRLEALREAYRKAYGKA